MTMQHTTNQNSAHTSALQSDFRVQETCDGYSIMKHSGAQPFMVLAQVVAYIVASALTALAVGLVLLALSRLDPVGVVLRGTAAAAILAVAFYLLAYAHSAARTDTVVNAQRGNLRQILRTSTGRTVGEREIVAKNVRALGLVRDNDNDERAHLCLWIHDLQDPMTLASGPTTTLGTLCTRLRADLRLATPVRAVADLANDIKTRNEISLNAVPKVA